MRKTKPRMARADEVIISRDGEEAIIEFLKKEIAAAHLRIGPEIQGMSDEESLSVYNQTIAAQIRRRDELGEYVVVKVPAGSPQIVHRPDTANGWTPNAALHLLRRGLS